MDSGNFWAAGGVKRLTGYFILFSVLAEPLCRMVFGGISGSALADLAGVGTMVIQAMVRAGYRAEFSAALTVSSSLLAPILPPSIMFIIYSVLMNVSVVQMFAAGILPGIVLATILVINNVLLNRLKLEQYPTPVRTHPREVLRAGARALPALATPVVILRSMVSGMVTPTEASTVAVCYTLLLGVIYREVTADRLWLAFLDTARMTSLVMYLTGIGTVMGFVLTSDQVAVQLAHGIAMVTQDKWVVLALATLSLLMSWMFSRNRAGAADRRAAVRAAGGELGGRSDPFRCGTDVRVAAGHHPSAGRAGAVHGLRHHRAAAGSGGARQLPVLSCAAVGVADLHVRADTFDLAAVAVGRALIRRNHSGHC